MTPVKDVEDVSLNIAVNHLGLTIFQNFAKVDDFLWINIRKLCFKKKKFYVKIHDEVSFLKIIRNHC